VTEWPLRDRGIHRVRATALDSNLDSQRGVGKSGFACEGLFATLRTVRGEPRDSLSFAKTRADR
jgi:ribosomal-protein-alanine N-acetyltransferase